MNDDQRAILARAEAAQRIMEDPMVKEAFRVNAEAIIEAWKDIPARDVEGREHLHRMWQAQCRFQSVFRIAMEEGKVAAAELKAEEERKSLLQRAKERIYG